MPEHVSIIGGSGSLGHGVAVRLAAAGSPITIGSRSDERATQAAERVRRLVQDAEVDGHANPSAASLSDLVLLCVPFANQAETIASIRDALRPGALVVDATVPLAAAVGGRPTRMLGVWQGSAAEQAQSLLPAGVRVVSALHTVSAAMLADLERELDEDVLLAGDSTADKSRVAAMLRSISGLRPVDCGRLEQARLIESMTALLIGVNIRHKTHAGVQLTGLPTTA